MMGEWISVKDEFPKETGFYIVSDSDGFVTILWYFGRGSFDCSNFHVTHWMPLPKLPKSGSE